MKLFGLNREESTALTVSLSVSIVLLLFSIWYTLDMNRNFGASYIEVEFGEFRSGTLAEFSQVKNEEVARRPDPSQQQPEEPKEEVPVKEETPQQTTEEETKPVDLPKEIEEVIEEVVKTPDTKKVDPEKSDAARVEEEVEIPPQAQKDLDTQAGAAESGDIRGATGSTTADAGAGYDEKKSAPYELSWEGDLEREPMVQPLPTNSTNTEAVISVRFEVRPDGTVGRVIPLKKMNPELEKEVQRTLRSWRFSRLPSGAPQQAQWGTLTFRFVFN